MSAFSTYTSVQFMLGANSPCGITSGLIFIIIGDLCRITSIWLYLFRNMPSKRQRPSRKTICSISSILRILENLGEPEEDIDERVVEKEIVSNIKDFIIRFGTDFVFMGNQYRIEAAGEEMFIDLLFFNRELNCMVAVDLKSGKFRPSYLGQMTTYLTVLDDTVRKAHENPSIGLILCRDMNKAFVDYVIRDYAKPLGVATYSTTKDMSEKMKNALPDPEELKRLVLAQNAEDKE